MSKLTEFQKAFTKEHCIQICKKLHFTLTDEQLEKLKFSYKFTWVVVEFRVKNYGQIAFGIDNHHTTTLYGNKVTKKDIKEALDIGAIKFRVWRFVDDEVYVREKQAGEYVSTNFNKPSVDEFYDIYYED